MRSEHKHTILAGDVFGYLQQDTLQLIALATLVGPWVIALIFYDPRDARALVLWPPVVGFLSLGGVLALLLNHGWYRLAVASLVALPLLADGYILVVLRNAQALLFALPLIALAGFLVGWMWAAMACGGTLGLAGLAMLAGIPQRDLIGPCVLAVVNTVLIWFSSRYLYVALHCMWADYLRSVDKTKEAQSHRAELARTAKALDEAYQRLRWANEAFAHAWEAAEEARQFKARFAANISHELRTPLHIIVGFCETMVFAPESYGPRLPEAYRRDLMEVYRSSRHLAGLIDDVLDLSQIEAGRLGLSREPTDLAVLIEETAKLAQVLAKRKGLALDVEMPPTLPMLWLDRTRMRQVLLNLLNNAVRYTQQGGIRLSVEVGAQHIVVSVADTGPGIPIERQKAIFESFSQVEITASQREGGAGLGLAISKHLVEMHGGSISVESQPGAGSCFRVSLPLPGDLPATLPPSQLIRGAPPLPPSKGTVLLVHRDATIHRLLERHLDGYQVVCATGSEEARAYLRSTQPRAIILADEWTFEDLANVIHAPEHLTSTPVITCPLSSGAELAVARGARACLAKPLDRRLLLETIERFAPQAHRVLVVDDDPRMVRLLSTVLRSPPGGHEVQQALDGREALSLMRTERPDLVLLDLSMPVMDGFAVLQHMERDASLRELPVVVVSAKALPEAGVARLRGTISVNRPDGLALGEVLNALQALLDALAAPTPARPTDQGSAAGPPESPACR